jgi:hypothetical protein
MEDGGWRMEDGVRHNSGNRGAARQARPGGQAGGEQSQRESQRAAESQSKSNLALNTSNPSGTIFFPSSWHVTLIFIGLFNSGIKYPIR